MTESDKLHILGFVFECRRLVERRVGMPLSFWPPMRDDFVAELATPPCSLSRRLPRLLAPNSFRARYRAVKSAAIRVHLWLKAETFCALRNGGSALADLHLTITGNCFTIT